MKKLGCGSGCLKWVAILAVLGFGLVVITEGAILEEVGYYIEDLLDLGSNDGQDDSYARKESASSDHKESPEEPYAPDPGPVDIEPISFTREPYYPIKGCAPSRLHVGDRAIVSLGGGTNGIRTEPDTHPSDNIIYRAPSGEGMWIVDGPECNYEWILWKVKTDSGHVGWTPESPGDEFWLTPIEAESDIVASFKSDSRTYECYEKVNSTMHDPHLSESEKKEQIRVYQRTYGEEIVTTVMRYIPVYQENGTFTSFDSWARGFTSEYDSSPGSAPIESDPVGSAMSIFFDSSPENITEQLGLDSWLP